MNHKMVDCFPSSDWQVEFALLETVGHTFLVLYRKYLEDKGVILEKSHCRYLSRYHTRFPFVLSEYCDHQTGATGLRLDVYTQKESYLSAKGDKGTLYSLIESAIYSNYFVDNLWEFLKYTPFYGRQKAYLEEHPEYLMEYASKIRTSPEGKARRLIALEMLQEG